MPQPTSVPAVPAVPRRAARSYCPSVRHHSGELHLRCNLSVLDILLKMWSAAQLSTWLLAAAGLGPSPAPEVMNQAQAILEQPIPHGALGSVSPGSPEAWTLAIDRAERLVANMTLDEKLNITSGRLGPCQANSGSVPRLGIPSFCYNDGRECGVSPRKIGLCCSSAANDLPLTRSRRTTHERLCYAVPVPVHGRHGVGPRSDVGAGRKDWWRVCRQGCECGARSGELT